MSDFDELKDSMDVFDSRLDQFHASVDAVEKDLKDIKKVLGLLSSPDQEQLEKYKMLKKAYNEYIFVKRMVIGNE